MFFIKRFGKVKQKEDPRNYSLLFNVYFICTFYLLNNLPNYFLYKHFLKIILLGKWDM